MRIGDLLRVVRTNSFSGYDWGEEAVMFFNLNLPREHHLTPQSTGEDALLALFTLKSSEYESIMSLLVDLSSSRFDVTPPPPEPSPDLTIPNAVLAPTADHIPMPSNGCGNYNYGLPAMAPVTIDSNEPPAIGWLPIIIAGVIAVLLFGLVVFAISGNPSADPKSQNFVRRAVSWVLDHMQDAHDRAETVPDTTSEPVTQPPYIEPVYPAPVEPYYPPPPPPTPVPVPTPQRQAPRAIPPQNPSTEPESESQALGL